MNHAQHLISHPSTKPAGPGRAKLQAGSPTMYLTHHLRPWQRPWCTMECRLWQLQRRSPQLLLQLLLSRGLQKSVPVQRNAPTAWSAMGLRQEV